MSIVRRTVTAPKKPDPKPVIRHVHDRKDEFRTYATFADALAEMHRTREPCIMVSMRVHGLAIMQPKDIPQSAGYDWLFAKAGGHTKPVPLTAHAKAMYSNALRYTQSLAAEEERTETSETKPKSVKRPLKKRKP